MHYITKDVVYVGVNDHAVDLFEGQYVVPNGMSYNSYVVLDEKVCVFDTVGPAFHPRVAGQCGFGAKRPQTGLPHRAAHGAGSLRQHRQFRQDLSGRHCGGQRQDVCDDGAVFRCAYENRLVVKDGDTLTTGRHTFTFVFAPMVHWPEVMVTYDSADKILFSADGFGKFGALDVEEEWACEARRYYIGIVGKYGAQVQALLKKAAGLDIAIICPLHGPILTENLGEYIRLYDLWSSYTPESDGIVIAYTSVYGHTKKAVEALADLLREKGCPAVIMHDLARCDMAEAVEDAFRYNKLVLATTTYNAGIFPFMREFIDHLTERNFQKRTVALIENGTWAPLAAKVMKGHARPLQGPRVRRARGEDSFRAGRAEPRTA